MCIPIVSCDLVPILTTNRLQLGVPHLGLSQEKTLYYRLYYSRAFVLLRDFFREH